MYFPQGSRERTGIQEFIYRILVYSAIIAYTHATLLCGSLIHAPIHCTVWPKLSYLTFFYNFKGNRGKELWEQEQKPLINGSCFWMCCIPVTSLWIAVPSPRKCLYQRKVSYFLFQHKTRIPSGRRRYPLIVTRPALCSDLKHILPRELSVSQFFSVLHFENWGVTCKQEGRLAVVQNQVPNLTSY